MLFVRAQITWLLSVHWHTCNNPVVATTSGVRTRPHGPPRHQETAPMIWNRGACNYQGCTFRHIRATCTEPPHGQTLPSDSRGIGLQEGCSPPSVSSQTTTHNFQLINLGWKRYIWTSTQLLLCLLQHGGPAAEKSSSSSLDICHMRPRWSARAGHSFGSSSHYYRWPTRHTTISG